MTERRSRCTVPRAPEMEWRSFRDEGHPSVVELAVWIETLAPFAQDGVFGDIEALRDLAARGEIEWDPHPENDPKAALKPIRDIPELYELRWTILSKKVRQYHAEPPTYPDLLVDLHIHYKSDKSQDHEISQANLRFVAGASQDWKL